MSNRAGQKFSDKKLLISSRNESPEKGRRYLSKAHKAIEACPLTNIRQLKRGLHDVAQ
jgi:hypothetical protein